MRAQVDPVDHLVLPPMSDRFATLAVFLDV